MKFIFNETCPYCGNDGRGALSVFEGGWECRGCGGKFRIFCIPTAKPNGWSIPQWAIVLALLRALAVQVPRRPKKK
mgnify:CR=1 FL=1